MREIRRSQHRTQAQLARRLGMARRTIQKYEEESFGMSVAKLEQVAGILQVSVIEILGCGPRPIGRENAREERNMTVFRVERTKNYTVVSNYRLKDKRLSLKAKGLLSQMLFLPDDWNCTIAGLCAINRESWDAIRGTIEELEHMGYVQRRLTRFRSTEYYIHTSSPCHPAVAWIWWNREQSNHRRFSQQRRKQHNQIRNNQVQIYQSLFRSPFLRLLRPEGWRREGRNILSQCRLRCGWANRERIRTQLAYDVLVRDYHYQVVRQRFLRLDMDHVQYIADCIRQNASQVHTTMETHITAQVNHDRGII